MEKFLYSSQPDKLNAQINELRYKAFRSNGEEDKRALMLFLLHKWEAGDLVSYDLVKARMEAYAELSGMAIEDVAKAAMSDLLRF